MMAKREKFGEKIGHEIYVPPYQSSLATKSFNFTTMTADELWYLYHTDPYMDKVITKTTYEATRFWVKLPDETEQSESKESPEDIKENKDNLDNELPSKFAQDVQQKAKDIEDRYKAPKAECQKAIDWARLHGFSAMIFYDSNPELKDPLEEGVDYKIKAFHVYVQDLGGIYGWKLDEQNYPTELTIKIDNEDYPVDPSRIVIFSNDMKTGHWKGVCDAFVGLSDINSLRKLRSSLDARVDQYPASGAVIGTEQDVSAEDQTAAQEAFDPISVMVLKGGSVNMIGGLMTPTELDSATSSFEKAVVTSSGQASSDFFGADAGSMVSESKNRDMKNIRYEIILQTFEEPMKKVFEKLGLEWNGWASPHELTKERKVEVLQSLVDSFNMTQDEGMREIIANVTKDIFAEEAKGVEIKFQEEAIQEQKEQQMEMYAKNEPTSGNGGEPAEKGDGKGGFFKRFRKDK